MVDPDRRDPAWRPEGAGDFGRTGAGSATAFLLAAIFLSAACAFWPGAAAAQEPKQPPSWVSDIALFRDEVAAGLQKAVPRHNTDTESGRKAVAKFADKEICWCITFQKMKDKGEIQFAESTGKARGMTVGISISAKPGTADDWGKVKPDTMVWFRGKIDMISPAMVYAPSGEYAGWLPIVLVADARPLPGKPAPDDMPPPPPPEPAKEYPEPFLGVWHVAAEGGAGGTMELRKDGTVVVKNAQGETLEATWSAAPVEGKPGCYTLILQDDDLPVKLSADGKKMFVVAEGKEELLFQKKP